MREILGLARIQQIDTRIDQCQSKLEIIKSKLVNDGDLKLSQNNLVEVENQFTSAKLQLESSEKKLQDNMIKIEQSESNLYRGNIKNPKELQEIENEIASLKRSRAILEDTLLNDMALMEDLSKNLKAASSIYQKAESDSAILNGELHIEKQSILQEITILTEEKKVAEASLSIVAINVYNKLRKDKKGLAVATVLDGICNCCGSTLTPAKQQAIKSSNELITCSTCGRLLFSQ